MVFIQHGCIALHLRFAGDGLKGQQKAPECPGMEACNFLLVVWHRAAASFCFGPAQELIPSIEKLQITAGEEGGELGSTRLGQLKEE